MKQNKKGFIPEIKDKKLCKTYEKIGKLCDNWNQRKDAEDAKQRKVMPTPVALLLH